MGKSGVLPKVTHQQDGHWELLVADLPPGGKILLEMLPAQRKDGGQVTKDAAGQLDPDVPGGSPPCISISARNPRPLFSWASSVWHLMAATGQSPPDQHPQEPRRGLGPSTKQRGSHSPQQAPRLKSVARCSRPSSFITKTTTGNNSPKQFRVFAFLRLLPGQWQELTAPPRAEETTSRSSSLMKERHREMPPCLC